MVTDGRSGGAAQGRPSTSYTGAETGWNVLAEKLSALSRTLQNESSVDATLQAIAAAAADTVPGAECASISVVGKRRDIRTLAATGELSRAVDRAQSDTGEGPCLDSFHERRTVRLSDLSRDERWPDFSARAHGLGLGSMLDIPLHVIGASSSVLNLHSTRPDAFTDESEQVGLLLAVHAAVAMVAVQEQEQLTTAVHSRDLIGQAKGILMERYKIDANKAFRLLVLASQATNIKLADVAGHLTETGLLSSPQDLTPAGRVRAASTTVGRSNH